MNSFSSAEIVCVGTELLLGEIVNSNAAYLAARLAEAGIYVYHQQVVGDNRERLLYALKLALSRADIVFTIAGLGPTYDDITRETVAEALCVPLREDAQTVAELRAYFAAQGREMTENNLCQALCPEGGVLLRNAHGTAPGIWVEKDRKLVVMLPGPPREFCPLLEGEVLPRLRERVRALPLKSRTLRLYGAGEAQIEAQISEYMRQAKNPTVAPYVKEGEVTLRLTYAGAPEEADAALDRAYRELFPYIQDYLYTAREGSMQETLVRRFGQKKLHLAAAESCTGGMLGALLTEVPGASEVFTCSLVTYTNAVKRAVLGVSQKTLATHGAVSAETAAEMAFGAQAVSGAQLAVGVTGVAGPAGGSEKTPVGTVFIAVVFEGGLRVRECHFSGERSHVRKLACLAAMSEALRITGLFSPPKA